MTREDALQELELPTHPPEKLSEEKEFVAKKMGISLEEFERILSQPIKSYMEYPTEEFLYKIKDLAWGFVKKYR
jgi:hypothetical protein